MAQRQAKHDPQSQSRFDRQFAIAQLAALLAGWQSFPGCDCFIRKPDRQAAAIAKAGLLLPPVRDPELLPRNEVTEGGATFERHERDSRRRERKHAVPSDRLTNQPIRPSCTKVWARRSRCRNCLMVSFLFDGMSAALLVFGRRRHARVADPDVLRGRSGRIVTGTVAGFIPEWWPASCRNTRPAWIGIRTSL